MPRGKSSIADEVADIIATNPADCDNCGKPTGLTIEAAKGARKLGQGILCKRCFDKDWAAFKPLLKGRGAE